MATLEPKETLSALEALRESEEFNRSIVESSRDCIKILSLEGRLLRMTAGGQKLICIDDINEFVGKPWENLWEERDHASARTAVAAAVAGGVGSFVGSLVTHKGEPKWWDVLITPLHDESGVANRLLAVSRDVTDRRRAELNASLLASVSEKLSALTDIDQILRVAGERLAEYIGISGLIFVQIDERAHEAKIAHEWRGADSVSMLGTYSLEQFLEPDLLKTSRDGSLVSVGDAHSAAHTSRVFELTHVVGAFISVPFLRHDRWCYSVVVNRADRHTWAPHETEVIRELGARVVHNIERAWAETALQESEARFRHVADAAPVLMWMSDTTTQCVWFNRSWLAFTGMPVTENAARDWTDGIHPEDVATCRQRYESSFDARAPFEIEYRRIRADGEYRWLLDKGIPRFGANQEFLGYIGSCIDITERRGNEEALRRSEALFRAIGDSIDYGIWICDASGRNTYASASFLNLVGITQEECSDFGWGDRLHPDARQETIAAWKECVLTGCTWDREHYFRGAEGDWHTVLARGAPVRDANGTIIFWAGINLDITNLKRTEASLARAMAESEQDRRLYHTVLSNTPDFIYVFDLNHRFTYINEALLKVYGFTWEEANGRDWIGLGYEQWHADKHDREIDEVIATKAPIRGEIPFSGTNGRRVYDYIFTPVLDANGEVIAVAGSTRDVTERKQAEAARDAERKVFERVATGASLLETLDTLIRETEAQTASGLMCAIDLLNATGQTVSHASAPSLPARNGAAPSASMPIHALDGELLGTLSMHYREQRTPDAQDLQLVARAVQLAAIIIERKQAEVALDENAARLKEADRSKDQFLAMLAHELRNPLAPIRNATAILQDAAASTADRDRAQRLIARQTENMSRIIDDLLDVSRITEGKIELRLQAVQLRAVVAAAAEDARVACEANGQQLSVSLPDEPIFLRADPTRLEQLFGNLLSNASKHSGVGSHIRVTVEVPDEANVVVHVADNGVGIEPELLPRIFELFVQSSITLDRAHGGLGIGLTIVDRLVKLHGGTITAESAGVGHGTTFTIRLPRLTSIPPAPTSDRTLPLEEKSRRVLVVDDNEDAAESMAILLQLRGHDTRTAHAGPDAVAVARDFSPDVVLLDIGLPEMDGYEVARRLRKIPALSDAFLVALTGYGTAGDRDKARLAGFDEHMAKPADLSLLREWLARRVRDRSSS